MPHFPFRVIWQSAQRICSLRITSAYFSHRFGSKTARVPVSAISIPNVILLCCSGGNYLRQKIIHLPHVLHAWIHIGNGYARQRNGVIQMKMHKQQTHIAANSRFDWDSDITIRNWHQVHKKKNRETRKYYIKEHISRLDDECIWIIKMNCMGYFLRLNT